jgi:hypothetical protein
MNKRIIYVLTVILAGITLSGCSWNSASGPKVETGFEVASELKTVPTGQVEQKQLESEQKVDPKSDDLNTIESEVNSTVILKEDYSDL